MLYEKTFFYSNLAFMFFNYSQLIIKAANPKIQLLNKNDKDFIK